MEIQYKPQAVKQLRQFNIIQRRQILNKIEKLTDAPFAGKKLMGELKGFRSLRIWPYRIIYTVTRKSIMIYSVAHRQSVYKLT